MRCKSTVIIVLVVLTFGSLPASRAWAETVKPAGAPNIVIILADDMGYGDVHALNKESKIPTPNLDGLAARGMTFTDAHTPSSVCTPTRYGLLTGRYCWRSRMKRGVLNGYSAHLIDTERQTVASLLKSRGYQTGCVGKWHLGLDWTRLKEGGKNAIDFNGPVENGPNALGFDFFYGIPASLDFPPYVYVKNNRVVELPTAAQAQQSFPAYLRKGERSPGLSPENVLDDLLAQARSFIQRSAGTGKPFFLYFPLTAPHKPVLPHPRFRKKTALGPYGDFVVQVDWTVGQVLKTLKSCGVDGNTLVVFTSDNGSFMFRKDGADEKGHVDDPTIQAYRADRHTANHVFRGTKADIWEAGHRVPFFACLPGRIKPGSRCDEVICLTDLMATCAALSGAKMAPGAGEDSFNLRPLMEGRPWRKPRLPVVHHSAGGMFAIRSGPWKLVLGNGSGGREQPRGRPFQKPYALFDMTRDVRESRNVAARYPDVVETLAEQLEVLRGEGKTSRKQE